MEEMTGDPLEIIITNLIEKCKENQVRYIITQRMLVIGLSSLLPIISNTNLLKHVPDIIQLICALIEEIRSKIIEIRPKYTKKIYSLSDSPVLKKQKS